MLKTLAVANYLSLVVPLKQLTFTNGIHWISPPSSGPGDNTACAFTRSPDEAQRNPGKPRLRPHPEQTAIAKLVFFPRPTPDCASLHPGYKDRATTLSISVAPVRQ